MLMFLLNHNVQEDYTLLLDLAEMGKRITYAPSSLVTELSHFQSALIAVVEQVKGIQNLDEKVKNQVLALLKI